MTWHEFRQWARRNGWHLPPYVGGSGQGAQIARVLALDTPGSGHHRTYGPTEQRRLAMHHTIREVLTGSGTRQSPHWMMDAIDLAAEDRAGWVCHSDGRTWWTDHLDPLPHLAAGIFAAPIWRP